MSSEAPSGHALGGSEHAVWEALVLYQMGDWHDNDLVCLRLQDFETLFGNLEYSRNNP